MQNRVIAFGGGTFLAVFSMTTWNSSPFGSLIGILAGIMLVGIAIFKEDWPET
jgi:hypothetical membrane protein